jgi:hypothetical protein
MLLVYLKLKKVVNVSFIVLLAMFLALGVGVNEGNALLMNTNLDHYQSSSAGGFLFFVICFCMWQN